MPRFQPQIIAINAGTSLFGTRVPAMVPVASAAAGESVGALGALPLFPATLEDHPTSTTFLFGLDSTSGEMMGGEGPAPRESVPVLLLPDRGGSAANALLVLRLVCSAESARSADAAGADAMLVRAASDAETMVLLAQLPEVLPFRPLVASVSTAEAAVEALEAGAAALYLAAECLAQPGLLARLSAPPRPGATERQNRRAEALRANLRRRKSAFKQ